MAYKGSMVGNVVVGESGAPDVSAALSVETGILTEHNKGKLKVAAGTHFLSFGAVALCSLMWIKIRDHATGNPRLGTILLSKTSATTAGSFINTATISDISDYVTVAGDTPTTIFDTAAVIVAGAGDSIIDYIFAGAD